MSDSIPITQGLRDYCEYHVSQSVHYGAILDMCAEIDALHKSLEEQNAEMQEFCNRLEDAAKKREDVTIFGADYTALPLDADKVPIHVGDDMQSVIVPASHGTVYRMELTRDGWWIYFGSVGTRPEKSRHHHKPTVMDVLDELLMNWPDCEGPEDELALKQRCAERLRLADGDAE